MAAFEEFWKVQDDGSLIARITSAIVSTAIQVAAEDPGSDNYAKRLKWAAHAVRNPVAEAKSVVLSVFVGEKGQPLDSIKALDDSTLESIVFSRVNLWAEGI